jgi:NNP family nitrate/nitrite transporter-like MFS transporter
MVVGSSTPPSWYRQALATWLLTFAYAYTTFLIAALGVDIAYVSKWYAKEQQGTALGTFGAGNVGAAVTYGC